MIHSAERVKAIRDRVAADLEAIAYLEAQTKDPGFRQRLQLLWSTVRLQYDNLWSAVCYTAQAARLQPEHQEQRFSRLRPQPG